MCTELNQILLLSLQWLERLSDQFLTLSMPSATVNRRAESLTSGRRILMIAILVSKISLRQD
jgi:hypothetical protein